MESKALHAIMLVGLLLVSGCIGSVDTEEEVVNEPTSFLVTLNAEWGLIPDRIQLDGSPIQMFVNINSDLSLIHISEPTRPY